MAVDILIGDKGACFFNTDGGACFGPLMPDGMWAEAFRLSLPGKDPRSFHGFELENLWEKFLDTHRLCPDCGNEIVARTDRQCRRYTDEVYG